MSNTKLNYNIDTTPPVTPQDTQKVELPENKSGLKNKTKISMQKTVMSALSSTQPTNNPSAIPATIKTSGWGRS